MPLPVTIPRFPSRANQRLIKSGLIDLSAFQLFVLGCLAADGHSVLPHEHTPLMAVYSGMTGMPERANASA